MKFIMTVGGIILMLSTLTVYSQGKRSVARETVLFEIGTGVGCANCTSVTEAMDSLVLNGKDVSVIKYHWADKFESEDGFNRKEFYEITANPTTVIDGKERVLGGGYQMNLYPDYLEYYEKYIDEAATMDIQMEVVQVSGRNYKLTIDVVELESIYDTKLNLRIALIESHIPHDWFYLNEVNFVCRDMIKNDLGFRLDFSKDSINTFDLNYEVDTAFNIANCEIVAFVQHDGNLEIMQAVKAELPYQEVSVIEGLALNNIEVYPNPVTDKLFIKGIKEADRIEIRNILGQLIYERTNIFDLKYGIHTSSLIKGTYAVIIYKDKQSRALKFFK